jgi:hypothetical protein
MTGGLLVTAVYPSRTDRIGLEVGLSQNSTDALALVSEKLTWKKYTPVREGRR